MAGPTWAHRATYPLVRLLVRTPVTPDHRTALRLVTGIIAAALAAIGAPLFLLLACAQLWRLHRQRAVQDIAG